MTDRDLPASRESHHSRHRKGWGPVLSGMDSSGFGFA